MAKQKFEPNVWIIFEYENITCIGRTLLAQTENGLTEMVGVVDSTGYVGHLEFSKIGNARILNIVNSKKDNTTIQLFKEIDYLESKEKELLQLNIFMCDVKIEA